MTPAVIRGQPRAGLGPQSVLTDGPARRRRRLGSSEARQLRQLRPQPPGAERAALWRMIDGAGHRL